MFIQHQSFQDNSKDFLLDPSKDFELIIHTKTFQKITGIIQFQYLQKKFSAAIQIQSNSIQIKAQQAFEGIQLSAPIITEDAIAQNFYLQNGTLSKNGHQNIVWLILDFIHLYNVLRLKPGKAQELYRETFAVVKKLEPQLIFGKIDSANSFVTIAAQLLQKNWKRQFKYEIGNPLDLLFSIQILLANYPFQFINSKNNKVHQTVKS